MQKRGVFVDAEDFLPVTATYPKHPLSENVPNVKTTVELTDQRKKAYKDDILRKQAEFASHCKKIAPFVSKIPMKDMLLTRNTLRLSKEFMMIMLLAAERQV